MPKKTHQLNTVAIKKETHEKVMRLSKKRKMFDYEIVEEALQEYFNKNS